MTLNNFIEGLLTLKPYYNSSNGYHIGAEHDQFYCYATENPLTEEDVKKMRELGWFQIDTSEVNYDPEDGWSAFT